jgi:hypothetical protein
MTIYVFPTAPTPLLFGLPPVLRRHPHFQQSAIVYAEGLCRLAVKGSKQI